MQIIKSVSSKIKPLQYIAIYYNGSIFNETDDIWCCHAHKKYSNIFLLYMMWQLHDGEKISSEKLNQIIVIWAKSATDDPNYK